MEAIFSYIITTDNRYNNTKKVGDKKLILNTEITERDAQFVNRIGKVLAAPRNSVISDSNRVIVHHNVFRRWYDMQGEQQNSINHIKDNLYSVEEESIFGYDDGNGWKAMPGFTFIKPEIGQEGMFGRKIGLRGTVVYLDKDNEMGIEEGMGVTFTPSSEYEFDVEGETLYRVRIKDISTILWNSTKKKKKNA